MGNQQTYQPEQYDAKYNYYEILLADLCENKHKLRQHPEFLREIPIYVNFTIVKYKLVDDADDNIYTKCNMSTKKDDIHWLLNNTSIEELLRITDINTVFNSKYNGLLLPAVKLTGDMYVAFSNYRSGYSV